MLTLRGPSKASFMKLTTRGNSDTREQVRRKPRVMIYGVGFYGMEAVRIVAKKGWPIVAVMVRVDSLARGKQLTRLYTEHTSLNLAFVSGAHSLAKITHVINRLKRYEIDGIVCVNMFGEGFNLPALKIAAFHSSHKSMAVTLQFIGRFGRANQTDVGPSTFLAEPLNSNAEIRELYETGAVRREIIQNLSEARIESEISRRDVLDSFAIDAMPDMNDFSLYMVYVVAGVGLVGPTVAAPVVGDHPVVVAKEEGHLGVPVVRRKRPAVAEHDRLARAPILVEDVYAVRGGNGGHQVAPSAL
jgi:Helicase conserved C-terminal domain